MKKIIFLLFLLLPFLIIKIANNSIRLSDTNIYFNIAHQIVNGKLLYQDIFFSNFPVFAYLSSFYFLITGKNIELFYLTSSVEVAITTIFIYLIVFKKTKDYIISIISALLYIFSFMVLSTSDHQTGVFTASLLAVLSYFFLQKGKMLLTGVFIALALLTKAYFAPIFISIFIYILLKKQWKDISKLSIGFFLAVMFVLLPFLFLAPKEFFSDIFGFSLTRPTGLSKINIMWFFITKDFPLFILLLFNIFNIRKNILFGLISIFSIVFFFAYQDVYYLYLNFLTPFLCLSFYEIYYFLKSKFNPQRLVIPTIISFFILLNLITYISNYRNLGKVGDINKLIKTIKDQNPNFLYGVNDIAPALITLTNIPALDNVNDAHEYFFTRKVYDKELLTNKAVKSRTMVIAHGADYSENNIKQDILDNIFVKETIYKNCKLILSVPVVSEGDANRINLFKCY